MASVRVIPASLPTMSAQTRNASHKRRVAAYARVSTDSEEQLTSYEAQVDYYTKFIQARADWEFVGMYTDEGISAVNTKRREGFKQMVADGLAGKFDLLVTKSVSRFARNTVDSLTTVRKLKENGVEIWFEKENIYTMDSKGELLITIMSSLAQEESRSISENVTWGQRKRMADGKFNLPYGRFLGYKRGKNGLPEIVPEEAEVVRTIFRLYMEGKTTNAIASILVQRNILSPGGKKRWQECVVNSILTNEKYKGDALLQKTFCADFLTKKTVKNQGQVQQYYIEESHPAIIDPEEWDLVQYDMERRKKMNIPGRCKGPMAGKLVCGDCGGYYGRKVWASYKENKTYRQEVYQCNDKYKGKEKCRTTFVKEDRIKAGFLKAFNTLMVDREGLIEDCRLAQTTICDTTGIENELAKLLDEVEDVAELSRKAIAENARGGLSQDAFQKQNDKYLKRYTQAKARIDFLELEKQRLVAKSKILNRFIEDIKDRPLVIDEWDESLWIAVIEKVVVNLDDTISYVFRNGREEVVV